ncbi:hypothetical protein SAMN05216559_4068 [Halomicrobium zhouii]|uniref:Uncharacterized protein n=1 Tax=Halomicrobium zhouii TaxID=767519 RepID=A0A1I6M9B4_9EURY|nr:hypothetical protein [Halomicrobium zhouii]SFS12314.1 hypothetical protein SAMN05216559_4068 [Halomicrobium zhouii]
MSAESTLERFSRKGRRVLFVVIGIFLLVAGGGLYIALQVGPLQAVVYVLGMSALTGFLFPRLV